MNYQLRNMKLLSCKELIKAFSAYGQEDPKLMNNNNLMLKIIQDNYKFW